jgi:uncharacterized protein YcnI
MSEEQIAVKSCNAATGSARSFSTMSENYDEFMVLVYLTDDLTPGRTLYFPTVHSARAAYTSTAGIMSPPKLDPAAQPLIVHAACEGLKAGSDVYRHPGKIPAL